MLGRMKEGWAMFPVPSFRCQLCGGDTFRLQPMSWFVDYVRPLGQSSALFADYSSVTEALAAIAGLATSAAKIKDPGITSDMFGNREYPWMLARCTKCEPSSKTTLNLSDTMYGTLALEAHRLKVSYASGVLGVDLQKIGPLSYYGSFVQGLDDLLKEEQPESLEHVRRMMSVAEMFSSEKGGDEGTFSALLYAFSVLASGLATNFLYDLLKFGITRVKRLLSRKDERVLSRRTLQKVAKEGHGILSQPKQLEGYSEDILAIIASMPARTRKRVVEAIVEQHAKNVKQLLLKALSSDPPRKA